MEFEFAKYTEVTDYAHEVNPEYKRNGYTRVFICPDVWTFWLVRILTNTNEDFENEEGSFIMERNNIEKERKSEKLNVFKLKRILENDEFENYDFEQSYNEAELIDMIDEGLGILNLKE